MKWSFCTLQLQTGLFLDRKWNGCLVGTTQSSKLLVKDYKSVFIWTEPLLMGGKKLAVNNFNLHSPCANVPGKVTSSWLFILVFNVFQGIFFSFCSPEYFSRVWLGNNHISPPVQTCSDIPFYHSECKSIPPQTSVKPFTYRLYTEQHSCTFITCAGTEGHGWWAGVGNLWNSV